MIINPIQLKGWKANQIIDPTVTDDITKGYVAQSIWNNKLSNKAFICLDNAAGAAIWEEITNSTSNSMVNLPIAELDPLVNPGEIVRYDPGTSTYVLAKANNVMEAEVIGILLSKSATSFNILINGKFTIPGASYTPGAVYYLSVTTAGQAVNLEPVNPGEISKPLFIAISADTGYFYNWRGIRVTFFDSTGSGGSGSTPPPPPPETDYVAFSQVNLTGNIFNFTHTLNEQYLSGYILYDNNNEQTMPTKFVGLNATTCQLDLTGLTPISGTWKLKVRK